MVLLAAAIGFLAARLLWLLLAPVLAHPAFQRLNYRDRVVPCGAGIIIALVPVFAEAVRVTAGAAGLGARAITAPRAAILIAATGFGLIGLLDDIAAVGDDRGLRGHLGALFDEGRLTTGGLKLVAGGALAMVAVSPFTHHSLGTFLADAALVALAANLANLFDRAPGRTIKVSSLAFAALAAVTVVPPELVPAAMVGGAAVGLLLDDLHERLMLGDAGANVIGAAFGIGAVATTSVTTRVVLLVVVAAANLASERFSFSRVIDETRALRGVDRWGRL